MQCAYNLNTSSLVKALLCSYIYTYIGVDVGRMWETVHRNLAKDMGKSSGAVTITDQSLLNSAASKVSKTFCTVDRQVWQVLV